jgi:DNA-binding NarL/FixJ family response regulator
MEFDAARWVFQQLGALPDLARVDALTSPADAQGAPGGLTMRELDVLRLIAAGQTNKEIGAALVISEHTVARHVQNMLAKLGCSSRAALAAFAIEHRLAEPPRGQF